MESKHKLMGQENMTRLIVKFSIPSMIGLLVNAFYNIVDRIYIGRIPNTGHYDIAAVGLTMPMTIASFAIALSIGMGASTLISLRLGEKKKKLAEKYLGNAIIIGAIFSILLTVVTLFSIDGLLGVLGASENTFKASKDYIEIIAIGYLFTIVGYTANAAIRSDGNPKIAMCTILIGAILNIILDPIFIFWMNMGVKGAAWATIISQFASMMWALSYFYSKRSGIKLLNKNFKLKPVLWVQIIRQGTAPGLLQLGSGLVVLVFNNMLKITSGDYAVSAMTIVQGINMFFIMPIFGINQALLPLAGYNYGAKLYDRVKGLLKRAILGAVIIGFIAFLSIQFGSKYFIYLFTYNQEVVSIAAKGLKLCTLVFPLAGFQIVSSIYFQAIGKPKVTMFLTLSRQVIFLIPLIIILGKTFGGIGVWIAAPIADSLSFLVTLIMVKREIKNLNYLKHKENILE